MRCGLRVDFEFSLAANFVHWRFISELSYELISLDVDVLLAWRRLWSLHITGEEFFGCLSTLLLKALWVILLLVGLEELVRIGSSRDDHGSVGASTEHTLVKGDVLREVGLLINSTIWVLVFLLLRDDARVGSEALTCGSGLLHHFKSFDFEF